MHEEPRTGVYTPRPVRRQRVPKVGKPGEWHMLGIPTVYDRAMPAALVNRLGPIFDDSNFGYRRWRSTKDALRKFWKEVEPIGERIVDAELKGFFGSV